MSRAYTSREGMAATRRRIEEVVRKEPELHNTTIAQRLGVSRQTVSRVRAELRPAGYRPPVADGRSEEVARQADATWPPAGGGGVES